MCCFPSIAMWDNEYIPNPSQHQRTDGIIHHRLVINWELLFANTLGNRVKPRAGASGEYYSFHCYIVFPILL